VAGEWIKFEASTPEKREVFSITAAMGWTDPDLTVGKLLKVWRWFDQQTVGGNADGVTLALLDSIIGVSGFAQAMCNVGWLVSNERGVSLPNFDRHNGKTAKERALTAKRVAKHKTNASTNAEGNADTVSGALPKEEKNREELKEPPKPPVGGLSVIEGEKRKDPGVSLKTFLDDCKAKGLRPVRDYEPLWNYVRTAKLPEDYVALAWAEFCRQCLPGGVSERKLQVDWPKTFRNYVEKNYLKLWAINAEGEYFLTTLGKQAQTVAEAA
jgi:hypothetical protein